MQRFRPLVRPFCAPECGARAGFSLVELVFVMALGGLLLAIALPHIDRIRMQVDGQDQALRARLMMAQRLAVTRGFNVVVVFDTAARTLVVLEDRNGNMVADAGERTSATTLEGGIRFARGSAPAYSGMSADISFRGRQGSRPAMVFHRDGSASEAGVFYITSLRSTAGAYKTDTRAFNVEHATGRILAFRYDGSSWKREM